VLSRAAPQLPAFVGFAYFREMPIMPPPEDTSQPRLAAGCRWGGTEEDRVILFPEGAIKLQGTGRQVLERCDGQRTFAQIIQELQTQFTDADSTKIRTDISQFLEQLRHKRIVDY
jgi:pyrroloquinoline quinone biosynthesis protein D